VTARTTGHTVIAVAVPPLDDWVRERTARYDASFVSADPSFGQAHLTLLGPWLPAPTVADLEAVGAVLADVAPFVVRLAEVGEFAGGEVNAWPSPSLPFARLTAALADRFPETPPYGGAYSDLVPHVTLDHRATGATAASVRADLAGLLPVSFRVTEVQLQRWANHDTRVLHTWPLQRRVGAHVRRLDAESAHICADSAGSGVAR
jgi:2'-5' RNA ligase